MLKPHLPALTWLCLCSLAVCQENNPSEPVEVTGRSSSADSLTERVRQQVTDAMDNGLGPGVVVAVIRDGNIACRVAQGMRRADEPNNPLTTDDKVHLGSCTKAMTGTLIGMLVDDGTLKFSDTVGQRLPQVKARIHADWHNVTLLELLQHRSGLPGAGPFYTDGGHPKHETRVKIVMQILQKPRPEDHQRGTYGYSNLGYLLAAVMAEQATEKSWEDLIKQRVFQPLNMTSAGFGPPDRSTPAAHAWGHRQFGEKLIPIAMDNPLSMAPAGCVHCTISDWCRFIKLHLNEDTPKLLSKDTLQQLHTPAADGQTPYACGWIVKEIAGQRVIWHNGSNTMWYAAVNAAPETDTAVLVVCNGPIENQQRVEALNEAIFASLFAAP